MADTPEPKEGGAKSILKNPLVLIGAGAIVLYVLVKGSGSGSGGGGTNPATATAVQQALSDQQKAVADALAAQSKDNTTQMQANAASLADALKLLGGQNGVVTPPDTATQTALQKLQEQVASLVGQKPVPTPVSPPSATTADPFPLAGTVPIGPNSPGALAALAWSNAIGLPFEWGLAFTQHFGRLPSSVPELDHWFAIIGQTTSDGQKCIGGHCVPGPGYVAQA